MICHMPKEEAFAFAQRHIGKPGCPVDKQLLNPESLRRLNSASSQCGYRTGYRSGH